MGDWKRHIKAAAVAAAVLLVGGCYYGPPAYTETAVVVAAPAPVFQFSGGVEGYYEPAYATYVYGSGGYYYRWVGSGWVYTATWGGYWQPVPPALFLPPLLVYGPPPPIIGYRPYFVWWRARVGGWYAVNHPVWWQRHEMYLAHYSVWHARVVRYYENHPGYRPRMRPVFHGRPGGADYGRERHGAVQGREDRFGRPGPADRGPQHRGPAGRDRGGPGPEGRGGPGPEGRGGHGRHCRDGDC